MKPSSADTRRTRGVADRGQKGQGKARTVVEFRESGNGRSLDRILEGALAVLSRRGATLLSMIDVCEAAGVSRATLYRYFAQKDDLLAAVGEYVSRNFIAGVSAAAQSASTPAERLGKILDFTTQFTMRVKADRMLEVEPKFVLGFLRSHFAQHVAAFNTALGPVYDDIEAHSGIRINRKMASEVLMRAQESISLIPAGPTWNGLADALPRMLQQLYDADDKPAKGGRVKKAS